MDSSPTTPATLDFSDTNHDFNLSEIDSISDSDWLDVSSHASEDESAGIPEDDHDGVYDRPPSRRSVSSRSSSRDGDVEGWEGLVEGADVDDDALLHEHSHSAHLPADAVTLDVVDSSAEEQRVKEALDQSMISTLSSSRTSSLSSSTHGPASRPRDLRLSFPDPLTSSQDELNGSYEDVSPALRGHNTQISCFEPGVATIAPSSSPKDPGLSSIPEVPQTVDSTHVDFQIVLYGVSTMGKWQFVEKLLGRLALGLGLALSHRDTRSTCVSIYTLNPDHARILASQYTISILDRTDSSRERISDTVSKTLAVVFLPSALSSLPSHTLYLPVFTSPSVPIDTTGLSRSFLRQAIEDKWQDLRAPLSQLLLVNEDYPSAVISEEEVNTLEPSEVVVGFRPLLPHGRKGVNMKALTAQLSSVSTMTILGLLSIVLAYIVSGSSPAGSIPVVSKVEKHPSTSLATIISNGSNHSSIHVMPPTSTVLGTTSLKDFALAVFSPVSLDSSYGSQRSRASPTSGSLPITSSGLSIKKIEGTSANLGELSSKQLLAHPLTTSLSLTNLPGSKAVSIFHVVAEHCKTKIPAPTAQSMYSLSTRLASSLSDIFSAKMIASAIQADLKELLDALNELLQVLETQTAMAVRWSKAATDGLREQLYRGHLRAQQRALQIRRKGEQTITTFGEQAKGRIDQAKSRARAFKDRLSSEVAVAYQNQWAKGIIPTFNEHVQSHKERRAARRLARRKVRGRLDL